MGQTRHDVRPLAPREAIGRAEHATHNDHLAVTVEGSILAIPSEVLARLGPSPTDVSRLGSSRVLEGNGLVLKAGPPDRAGSVMPPLVSREGRSRRTDRRRRGDPDDGSVGARRGNLRRHLDWRERGWRSSSCGTPRVVAGDRHAGRRHRRPRTRARQSRRSCRRTQSGGSTTHKAGEGRFPSPAALQTLGDPLDGDASGRAVPVVQGRAELAAAADALVRGDERTLGVADERVAAAGSGDV